MKNLEKICQKENIQFNSTNSHCRCIAHIMNIAVQDILKNIRAYRIDDENTILNNTIINDDLIPKVSLPFIYYLYFYLLL